MLDRLGMKSRATLFCVVVERRVTKPRQPRPYAAQRKPEHSRSPDGPLSRKDAVDDLCAPMDRKAGTLVWVVHAVGQRVAALRLQPNSATGEQRP
jgi:hypothetical protein